MNFWTIALITAAVPLVLRLLSSAAAAPGTKGTLAYSAGVRRFGVALAVVPAVLLGTFAVLHPPRTDEVAIVVGLVSFFALMVSPLLLEFYRVSYSFDETEIRFRTPWSKNRSLAWSAVTTMKWRPTLKFLDLSDGTTVLHLSPLLTGLDEFARQCVERVPASVREADPEVAAVLALMEAGRGSQLAFAPARPSAMSR